MHPRSAPIGSSTAWLMVFLITLLTDDIQKAINYSGSQRVANFIFISDFKKRSFSLKNLLIIPLFHLQVLLLALVYCTCVQGGPTEFYSGKIMKMMYFIWGLREIFVFLA